MHSLLTSCGHRFHLPCSCQQASFDHHSLYDDAQRMVKVNVHGFDCMKNLDFCHCPSCEIANENNLGKDNVCRCQHVAISITISISISIAIIFVGMIVSSTVLSSTRSSIATVMVNRTLVVFFVMQRCLAIIASTSWARVSILTRFSTTLVRYEFMRLAF